VGSIVREVRELVRAGEAVVRLVTDATLLAELEIAVGRAVDELRVENGTVEIGVVSEDPGSIDVEPCLVRSRVRIGHADRR